MYEFHYDYITNKFGNKSRLSFTDTDSCMYEIEIERVDFSKNKETFDWSNLPAKLKYHDNWKALGFDKVNDQMCGIAIKNFFGSHD